MPEMYRRSCIRINSSPARSRSSQHSIRILPPRRNSSRVRLDKLPNIPFDPHPVVAAPAVVPVDIAWEDPGYSHTEVGVGRSLVVGSRLVGTRRRMLAAGTEVAVDNTLGSTCWVYVSRYWSSVSR